MAEQRMDDRCALKLTGVKRSFRVGDVEVHVLNGIDLEIYRGELTVIVGHSGSGKTTLLNIAGGIDRPSEGRVVCEGVEISSLSDRRLTEFRRRRVGFVFQFYNLVPALTARENVEVATEMAEEPMDPGEALEQVGLGDRADHFPSQLSGGEQQRVAIARAIAKRPAILLCDELTGALDSDTSRVILDLIVRLNEDHGMTVAIITHATPIAGLAHRVVRIDSGLIVEERRNERRIAVEEIAW